MTCPPEWWKLKTLEIPKVGKEEGQLEFSYFPGGSVKWYNHIRELLGSFL